MQIKRIKPLSLAKISGAINGIFGFLFGIFFLLVTLFVPDSETGGFVFGMFAPVFLTLMYGVLGFVMGLFAGWIYNVVAKRIGGIEIETE